jgi:flavin reductase (DIM6/NTAB) family NADH-FMN oxidoreductase RutF
MLTENGAVHMAEKIVLDSHGRCFTVKPVILVTTLGPKGLPNVAPKTQNMDVGSQEQYFAFVCSPHHHTYQNVKANQEFVVNYPGPELIEKVSAAAQQAGDIDEITLAGLTSIPSVVVKPPRVKECYLHLECKLVRIDDLEDSNLILGKIVARSADKEISFERGNSNENIQLLSKRPLLAYVYPNHYARIKTAEKFIFPKNYKP